MVEIICPLFIMDIDKKYNIITICGPTACGKTSLAVKIARKYGGEIISADSRQVYRGMDIGTGKDLQEYTGPDWSVPFHLIDVANPEEEYNLHRYTRDFDDAFLSVSERGNIPILTGGTGLYIEAALKGYKLSSAPENRDLRDRLNNLEINELREMLMKISPEMKTDLSSKGRIIRAIEICEFTGDGENRFHDRSKTQLHPLILSITIPRDEIIKRIDRRLEERLKEGMLEEVKSLMDRGLYDKMVKLGLEYRYCAMHLNGELSYNEFTEKLKTEIHRFAKRQATWFRGMERRGLDVHQIGSDDFKGASEIIDSSTFTP